MLLFIYGILNIPLVNGKARFEPFHIRAPPVVLAVCVNGIELGCPVRDESFRLFRPILDHATVPLEPLTTDGIMYISLLQNPIPLSFWMPEL